MLTLLISAPKCAYALDKPEHRNAADGIGGYRAGGRNRHTDQCSDSGCSDEGDGNEKRLSRLDPHIEGQQGERHIGLRQADFLERAGKAEAVQKAEGEGDDPWIGFRKPPSRPASS